MKEATFSKVRKIFVLVRGIIITLRSPLILQCLFSPKYLIMFFSFLALQLYTVEWVLIRYTDPANNSNLKLNKFNKFWLKFSLAVLERILKDLRRKGDKPSKKDIEKVVLGQSDHWPETKR
jgi:hypothetical protein